MDVFVSLIPKGDVLTASFVSISDVVRTDRLGCFLDHPTASPLSHVALFSVCIVAAAATRNAMLNMMTARVMAG